MNFTVYKSSAGSGKTFTLVREYLRMVLKDPKEFRHVLAITFTNKAANEMKERIISSLKEISEAAGHPESKTARFMLPDLIEETGLDQEMLTVNAQLVLKLILHNYSDFAISTIDSFVHTIIRSFAFDLHLPVNFEVELDSDELIQKAVDILISRVGTDEKLTQVLINFIQTKTQEEKSWDIVRDLTGIAAYLLKEDGQLHIAKLKNLSLDDFSAISKKIHAVVHKFENTLKDIAGEGDTLVKSKNIDIKSFYHGASGIGKYFENLANERFDKIQPNSYVTATIENDKWYSGKITPSEASAIDGIKDDLRSVYHRMETFIESEYPVYTLMNEIRKNIYPLAVLNEIGNVMDEYKSDNNILLISEFNKRIAEVVLHEPVPFIYERTGEKFRHYLVDEFQDTSVLQWQNLLPLIDNSLAEGNFNMIVGDGKQAIYRWRNGEVEQFAKLPEIYNRTDDPLQVQREQTLKRNYEEKILNRNFRSKKEIVEFNNDFFSFIATNLDEAYRSIYADVIQIPDEKNAGGSIHLEFYSDNESDTEFEDFNLNRIKLTIGELLLKGFKWKDIAILCRNNKQASLIAADLLENRINVVSSESLMLANSSGVRMLMSVVWLLLNNDDAIAKTELITWLTKNGRLNNDLHQNLKLFGILRSDQLLTETKKDFYRLLDEKGFTLNREHLLNLQIYDLFEELVRIFGLDLQPDPYIQFFLDAIQQLSSRENTGLSDLPDWWEENREKLSIVVPPGIDAVQVMTIHKSKGLEFPVVLFPFASEKMRKTKEKLWIDPQVKEIQELSAALVNTSKSLTETTFGGLYMEEENKSVLDLMNLLYVVMTRPSKSLFIFAGKPPEKSDAALSVPGLYKRYLVSKEIWSDDQKIYTFGNLNDREEKEEKGTPSITLDRFISNAWHNRMLLSLQAPEYWDAELPDKKKEWGNLIHLVLSKIRTKSDVTPVLDQFFADGIIGPDEKADIENQLLSFLNHPDVSPWFEPGLNIKTEAEILLKNGKTFRPDRLVFHDDKVTIIDFKTGKHEDKHREQIARYLKQLKEMNYTSTQGLLLYLNEADPAVQVNIQA